MSELYLMATISDRNQSRRFLAFYKEYGDFRHIPDVRPGNRGVGGVGRLRVRGIGKGRPVCGSDGGGMEKGKKGPGTGDQDRYSWNGDRLCDSPEQHRRKAAASLFDRGSWIEKEEESSLKGTDYELLVVIANQGYTDVIMDAARKANATGGTVIHAKGTGMEKAESF